MSEMGGLKQAAVNMLTVKQSMHYKDHIVIAMEPGHVSL